MMDDLVPWLRQQIDWDERAANDACGKGPTEHWQWVTNKTDQVVPVSDLEEALEDQDISLRSIEEYPSLCGPLLPTFAIRTIDEFTSALPHIVRWDPARVLAECDAKRQVLDRHEPRTFTMADNDMTGWVDVVVCWECVGREVRELNGGRHIDTAQCVPFPCPTVRAQGIAFRDRPGYQEAWRP